MSWAEFQALHFVDAPATSVTETPFDSNVLTDCANSALKIVDYAQHPTKEWFVLAKCGDSYVFTINQSRWWWSTPFIKFYIKLLQDLKCHVVNTQIVWKSKNNQLCDKLSTKLTEFADARISKKYISDEEKKRITNESKMVLAGIRELNSRPHPHFIFSKKGLPLTDIINRLSSLEKIEYFKQCLVILDCLRKKGCLPWFHKRPNSSNSCYLMEFFVLDGAQIKIHPCFKLVTPTKKHQQANVSLLVNCFWAGKQRSPFSIVIKTIVSYQDALNWTKQIQRSMIESPYRIGSNEFDADVLEWYQRLDQQEPKLLRQLAWASRLYSNMMDEFMNDATRGKTTAGDKLLKHLDKVLDGSTMFVKNFMLKSSLPGALKYCNFSQEPFAGFKGQPRTLETVRRFVKRVDQLLQTMHKIMTNPKLLISLRKPLVVYRGSSSTDFRRLWGFASTSVDINVARGFGPNGPSLESMIQSGRVKKIQLPTHTKVLPIVFCTFYDEDEVLVASQGKLVANDPNDVWHFITEQPTPPKPQLKIEWDYINSVIKNGIWKKKKR